MITIFSKRLHTSLLVIFFCSFPLTSQASIIYVDANSGSVSPDGLSWCTGYTDLQDALSRAAAGDEIRIADGMYLPDRGTGDREARFRLVNGVEMYGGYAGCGASNPNAREFVDTRTILSGDLNGDDGLIANLGDNSFNVVAAIFVDQTTILNGVTIESGNSNFLGSPFSRDRGSGIYSNNNAARFENCTIRNNHSVNMGAFYERGGATIIGCTFENNKSDSLGGALYIASQVTVPTITDCKFVNNFTKGLPSSFSSVEGGGAVANLGKPIFTNCQFTGNISENRGGAIYNRVRAGTTLNGCTFTSNQAEVGGAIYDAAGDSYNITGCAFTGNQAEQKGGAIYKSNYPVFITNSTFSNNRSISSFGGAIYAYNRFGQQARYVGCTFTSNSARTGGGMYVWMGEHLIKGCTFTSNEAWSALTSTPGGGGGVHCDFETALTIEDSVFNQNTTPGDGGGLYIEHDNYPILSRNIFLKNSARRGGGIYAKENGFGYMANCKFIANQADFAAGAYFYRNDPLLVNCLFLRNHAVNLAGGMSTTYSYTTCVNCTFFENTTDVEGRAGGIYSASISPNSLGSTLLNNCIFWGNRDRDGHPQSAQIFQAFDSLPVVNNSIVQGWDGSLDGIDSISSDPLLIYNNGPDHLNETKDDDLKLPFLSPAIDKGNEGFLPLDLADLDGDGNITEPVSRDLAGNDRVYWLEVDIGASELADCNNNNIHDAIDFQNGTDQDCNNNLILDQCDIQSGRHQDCNANNNLDVCDLADGLSLDVNENQLLDICEPDCNNNELPDEYEITQGFVRDCNSNSIPDGCDIARTAWLDCNENGFLDDCDIADGVSLDTDGNCIPDECLQRPRPAAELVPLDKSRYIAFTPTRAGCLSAIRITLRSLHHPDGDFTGASDFSTFENEIRWVGPPNTFFEDASANTSYVAAKIQCEPFFGDWDSIDLVHVYGDAILPSSLYEVQMVGSDCVDINDTQCHSGALQVFTSQWCDVVPPYAGFGSSQPDISDVLSIVGKWLGGSELQKVFSQLQPNNLNPSLNVSISDILVTVDAWLGSPYPYAGPTSCP